MKVLVTGANGHIGSHVVRQLLDAGHEVRAMVRKSADLRGLEGLKPEFAHGDIMDAEAVMKAAEGCDAIIHMAAVYKTIANSAEEIVAPAVAGAENVFKAAAAHQIKRIVYTSSVASIGFSHDPNVYLTNTDWNNDAHNAYYVAKTQSERKAQALARQYDVHLVVICPAIVIGPNDFRITPSNQLVMDWLNGVGQTYPGGLNLVDVRDVAAAHVAALTKGENGHRYIVGGENLSVRAIGDKLKDLVGIRPIYLPFGRSIMLAMARAVETVCRLLHIKPPFTYDLAYEAASRYCFFDTNETEAVLGIRPRPADESLPDAIRWLLQQNRLKPRVAERVKQRLN